MTARTTTITSTALAVLLAAIALGSATELAASTQEVEWTAKALRTLVPDREPSEEDDFRLVGRIIERDDEDADGNPIKRAFLQRDDGDALIPLPCERRDRDRGALAKAAGGLTSDQPSCWDFLGERVQIIGTVQSIQQGAKRFRRLARIGSIVLF